MALCAGLSPAGPLYDKLVADDDERGLLIQVYGKACDPRSTDELLRIAKIEKNQGLRAQAIGWLRLRDDPRVLQFLATVRR